MLFRSISTGGTLTVSDTDAGQASFQPQASTAGAYGSFTLAANQLGLSRALVSRHISDLEARLGVRLLNRSTRSLNLTEEGRSYLEFCERILREIVPDTAGVIVRTAAEGAYYNVVINLGAIPASPARKR